MAVNTSDLNKLAIDPTIKDVSRSFEIRDQEQRDRQRRASSVSSMSASSSMGAAAMAATPSSFFTTLAEVSSPLDAASTFESTSPDSSHFMPHPKTPLYMDRTDEYSNPFEKDNMADLNKIDQEEDNCSINSPPSEADSDSTTDEEPQYIPLDELRGNEEDNKTNHEKSEKTLLIDQSNIKRNAHSVRAGTREIEEPGTLSADEEEILAGYIPIMDGTPTNIAGDGPAYLDSSGIKLQSFPRPAIAKSHPDPAKTKTSPLALHESRILDSNPAELSCPSSSKPSYLADIEVQQAQLRLMKEGKKWRSIAYQEELIEGGFKLACELATSGDVALSNDKNFQAYRVKDVSPLRMCWIAPEYDEKGKGKAAIYDVGAAMQVSSEYDIPGDWRMTWYLAKYIKHKREKQQLAEKAKAHGTSKHREHVATGARDWN